MSTVWIRVAYGLVVAMLLALTVIFGITMVSPGPKRPADPGITFRQLSSSDDEETGRSQNQLQAQIEQFYGDASNFRSKYPTYQRNVFLAATGFGILFVLIGLVLPTAVNYLRWGLVLGSLLLFVYAFIMGTRPVPDVVPTGNSLLILIAAGYPEPLNFAGRFVQFAVAFIGLILTVFLGLWRLTEWPSSPRRATGPAGAPAGAAAGVASATAAPPAGQWAPPPAAVPPSPPSPAPPAGASAPSPAAASAAPVPAAVPATAATPPPSEPEVKETVEVRSSEWRRPE